MTQEMSSFARTIMQQKYSHTKPDGSLETWEEISNRVAKHVLRSVNAPRSLIERTEKLIAERKFIPGGRYLYAAGRGLHQVQNCALFKAEDSREGWADLMYKITITLMTGAGIGIDYSDIRPEGKTIRKTGGFATGPIALMQMVNEAGRGIVQGGSRRSAIWAGLSWKHPDVHKFISLKNWPSEVRTLKEKDFNFPATLDGTNISVLLDDEFFKAYNDEKHKLHSQAQSVYWATVRQMCKTAEPGFSIDVGENKGETLRNAPVCGDTEVLTEYGYQLVSSIVGKPMSLWTGVQWSPSVVFTKTSDKGEIVRVDMTGGRSIRCDKWHPFLVERYQGAGERRKLVSIDKVAANELEVGDVLHVSLPDAEGAADNYNTYRTSLVKVLLVEEDGTEPVYCVDTKVPEHSFQAEGVIISNCTEISSRDDSDICNLGSINLARISSLEEMREVVELGTAFLLAGTVYSDVPFAKIDQIRTKNRRLGLGLIGVHEWLLTHGYRYEPNEELGKYLEVYRESDLAAKKYAEKWELSVPVKTRAIAPTGTIGIVAESTTGIEPIFCVAYKRRYRKGQVWNYQYVIDPTAKKLVESGVKPENIEDAYSLAEDVERRVAFQAWVQRYVDHSISSTINLPEWGTEFNNEATTQEFGRMLLKYLPRLRGITCYPDGARGGQPLTAISYKTAASHTGEVFVESVDICDISKSGGSCGA